MPDQQVFAVFGDNGLSTGAAYCQFGLQFAAACIPHVHRVLSYGYKVLRVFAESEHAFACGHGQCSGGLCKSKIPQASTVALRRACDRISAIGTKPQVA